DEQFAKRALTAFNTFCLVLLVFAYEGLNYGAIHYTYPVQAQGLTQCLELEWIRRHFWQCLIYNHFQPPLFCNFILGLLYIASPSHIIQNFLVINHIAMFVSFLLFLATLNLLKIRQFWIFIFSLIFIFHPYRTLWVNAVFYIILSQAFLTAALFFFIRYVQNEKARWLAALGLTLVLLTWLNSYYHFAFACAAMLLAFYLSNKKTNRKLVIVVIFCAAALIVPLKNWLVFGSFSSSSTLGGVLQQRIGMPRELLLQEVRKGDLPSGFLTSIYDSKTYTSSVRPIPDRFRNIECLTKQWKDRRQPVPTCVTCEDFNYNYYNVFVVNREFVRGSLRLIAEHPLYYLKRTIPQFFFYFSGIGDMDPVFKSINYENHALSYRGALYILSFLFSLFWLLLNHNKWNSEIYKLVVFLAFTLTYGIVVGIFLCSDDGLRYRLPLEPYFLLLAAFAANHVRVSLDLNQ
ncbi:MAG: hypothetical protein ACREBJ_07890, partial [Nitrosotalea sp.]